MRGDAMIRAADADRSNKEGTMALLKPGDLAPSFALKNQDGVLTTLDQYRGHRLILWWYPKADTPG